MGRQEEVEHQARGAPKQRHPVVQDDISYDNMKILISEGYDIRSC
jgi:hypothetical protein